jgi:microcystin-dependent protein
MQIIFNIDDGLISRLKKGITLKRAALALTIFVILASALLFAATKPHTFTPGATISSSQVNENFDAAFTAVAKAVPPGTVMAYAGTTVPEGYLLCDGSSVSRTTYANLFASIGTTYGTGDGSTTFNLPDYRGLFLRGHHYGSANDPDYTSRILGTLQLDEFKSHNHLETFQFNNSGSGIGVWYQENRTEDSRDTVNYTRNKGGAETRPINRSVVYLIKS